MRSEAVSICLDPVAEQWAGEWFPNTSFGLWWTLEPAMAEAAAKEEAPMAGASAATMEAVAPAAAMAGGCCRGC